MTLIKYTPAKSETRLIEAAKAAGLEALTGKVISENKDGTYDIVLSVPGGSNELLSSVSEDRFEFTTALVKMVADRVKKVVKATRRIGAKRKAKKAAKRESSKVKKTARRRPRKDYSAGPVNTDSFDLSLKVS